jgi:hypothetical protein
MRPAPLLGSQDVDQELQAAKLSPVVRQFDS